MSGRDYDPHVGRSNGESTEMPADLAAVQADDALLDMLGNPMRTPDDVDGELARFLAAWRREVHADSNRLLVDTETALSVINAARRPARRRGPIFGPIAAAAAVLVIAFSAVGLVAKSAQPGDSLWGVTQVLYSDYARSVEAAALVRTELDEVRTALREGKTEQAKESLDRIQQQLPAIAEAEGHTDLTARHHELERELDAGPQDPAPESPDVSSSEQSAAPLDPDSSANTPSDTDSSTTREPDASTMPDQDSTMTPDPDSSTMPDQDSTMTPEPDASTPAGSDRNPPPEPTKPARPNEPYTQPRTKPTPPPSPSFAPPERPSPPPRPSMSRPTTPDPEYRGSVDPGQPPGR
jgi:Anti-sigma-D factor RsdA to sigma factor binding region